MNKKRGTFSHGRELVKKDHRITKMYQTGIILVDGGREEPTTPPGPARQRKKNPSEKKRERGYWPNFSEEKGVKLRIDPQAQFGTNTDSPGRANGGKGKRVAYLGGRGKEDNLGNQCQLRVGSKMWEENPVLRAKDEAPTDRASCKLIQGEDWEVANSEIIIKTPRGKDGVRKTGGN